MRSLSTAHISLTNQFNQSILSGSASCEAVYPLSPMQLGMLFHLLQSPNSGVDIEQIICVTSHPLDLFAFDRAWQKLLVRHSILRTSFQWQKLDKPLQQVHPYVDLPLKIQDCLHLSLQQQQELLDNYLQSDRLQGFDPSVSPLMRLAVLRWTEESYTWVWTFHHILLDGRSIRLLLQEFLAFYQAFSEERDFDLPPPVPYNRYIAWLKQQKFSTTLPYWQKLLQGFVAPTPLPPGYPKSNLTGHTQAQICLSAQATQALKATAKALNITPNTFIQGAWGLLLRYYSGEDDIVFGCTRACRRSTIQGAEGMIGLFINTLPVRVQISPETALSSYLRQLRSQNLKVRPYEHTPLIKVQQCSRIPARTPLFESLVVFEHYNLFDAIHKEYPSWQLQLLEQPSYPLVLLCSMGTQLELKLCYDQCRFDQNTVARLLKQLSLVIEQMIHHPEQPIKELSFLTDTEQRHILEDWNNTKITYPEQLRLHDLFEAQVEHNPEAIAAVCLDKRLSYGELNQRSNQLAHFLQGQGVKAEITVGVCIERSLEMIVALLAIVKAGGAYVPLDPNYPRERLVHIVSDSEVKLILTQKKLREVLPETMAETVYLDREQLIAVQPVSNPVSETTAQSLAYVIYTSGSTGKPKGVLINHQGAVNTILDINRRFSITEGDRVLAVCPLNFDLSVYDIFGVLGCGGTVILPEPSRAPDLQEWMQLMHREQVTLWNSSPLVLQMLVGYLQEQHKQLPESLRLVLLSGDWIPLSLPSTVRQLAPGDNQLAVISLGGATEASIWSIFYEINETSDQWKSIPYGKPLGNQWLYILDEQQELVGVGKSGELYIGGDGVARGYLNQPELNAKRFLADPFSQDKGRKLYRTGDLGRYMPDGNIELLGRIDHQIKIRGIRVELGEIESVFLQHPGVQECAVIVRKAESSNQQLIGYVVRSPDLQQANGQQLREEIRSFLKQKLPTYMIPPVIVWIEQLPLTENGKLDRQRLSGLESLESECECEGKGAAPRNALEARLVKLWQKYLGVTQVSIHDNFFELGGNSLVAMQLWSKWGEEFQQDLSIALLFQYPTIAALVAQLLQRKVPPVCPSLVTLQAGSSGKNPPLFCIHVLGLGLRYYRSLLPYLNEEQTVYGLSTQLTGEEITLNCVEDLARHYVKQMQQVQPQGPYLLLGFSFGGLVAYEMAQQLQSQGQTVALLGLLDTRSLSTKLATTSQEGTAQTIISVRRWTQNLATGGLPYLAARLRREGLKLAVIFFQLAQFPMTPLLQELLYTAENVRCGRKYTPQPYSGQVTLFKADQQLEQVDWDLGWSQLALGGIHLHSIPGCHEKVFEEPNVQILGKKLDAGIKMIGSPKHVRMDDL